MTFIISNDGIKNTDGTSAEFNDGGNITFGRDFENSGNVEIDIRANIQFLGKVSNAITGNFNIKDYVNERFITALDVAILDSEGNAHKYLIELKNSIETKNAQDSRNIIKSFIGYLKQHPEMITASIQILLQFLSSGSNNTPPAV